MLQRTYSLTAPNNCNNGIENEPGSLPVLSYMQAERHIYGSSRIGLDITEKEMIGAAAPGSTDFERVLGYKQFELAEHRGNVMAVVLDSKVPRDDNQDLTVDYYQPQVITATDYSGFGVRLIGRAFESSAYRYSFQGQEHDDEVKGAGNSYDYGARMLDSRLGRWFSTDLLSGKYTAWSTYHYAYDSPISFSDINGNENIIVVGGRDVKGKDDVKFINSGINAMESYINLSYERGEQTTIVLMTAHMTKSQVEDVQKHIDLVRIYYKYAMGIDANIGVVAIDSDDQLVNYINSKSVTGSELSLDRELDKITDIEFFGHGLADTGFEPGYGSNDPKEREKWLIDEDDISTMEAGAFAPFSSAAFYSCNAGTKNPSTQKSLIQNFSAMSKGFAFGYEGQTTYEYIYPPKSILDSIEEFFLGGPSFADKLGTATTGPMRGDDQKPDGVIYLDGKESSRISTK